MKKSLILVGMLVIGYANAQEGVVGINTSEPKATLQVTPSAENAKATATTNEGIMAPQLSKSRVAGIATPVEGTLVYVTDETTSPISAYTGADAKVAKITEKGYYFYNGTEWVKAGSTQSEFPWIYNADGNIELNHQNANYKAIYTDKRFSFKNFDGEYTYYSSSVDDGRTIVNESIQGNSVYSSFAKGSKLEIKNNPKINAIRNSEFAIGADNDTPDNIKIIEGTMLNAFTDANNTKDYNSIRGSYILSSHNGTGTVSSLNGLTSITSTFPFSKTTSQYAINSQASQFSDHNTEKVVGVRGFAVQRGAGSITNLIGVEGEIEARHEISKGNITNATGVLANLNFPTNRYTGSIENLAGVKITQTIASGALSDRITNNYGLYVGDVVRGVNPYSVYTNAGKVRVGDLADTSATADRVVTVDANGVLKAGGTIAANNGVQTQSSMTCTAENAGKINYTTIQKDGKDVGVFGFCMQKGTDYVWAYMLGGSNIYGTSANGAAFGQGL